jgi:hypothetical protein
MKKTILLLSASSALALSGCASHHPSDIQTHVNPRFQVSAWAFGTQNSSSHGCYIVDTQTGELWLYHGKTPEKVSGPLK